MKVLHVNSSPRGAHSSTLSVTNTFLDSLKAKFDDLELEHLNLFDTDLPAIAGENIDTKYGILMGQSPSPSQQASWQQIEKLIQQFMDADILVISSPMWNFGISYALKYYIDAIVQPGYLFKYNEQGMPEGMVSGKRMICITSRGADYSENSPFNAYDFQVPYLRAIFGFIGITDIEFINAQPLDIGPDIRSQALEAANTQAQTLAANY
ncbi:MAG: NAD(P)H-dependent oxidoreductase [Bacteroidota bacterium]